jgi:hypothetical protein
MVVTAGFDIFQLILREEFAFQGPDILDHKGNVVRVGVFVCFVYDGLHPEKVNNG